MTSFALITEGITDQVVLETVIQSFYSDLDDEVDFTALQPVRDATDESRQGDFGGWEKVLEYCTFTDRMVEALSFNDFVVIQIDTDCCEHENFGIPLTDKGEHRSVPDLISDVISKIQEKLTAPVLDRYAGKFIFAVTVHSIECWIIPLHVPEDHHKKRIHQCEDHLQSALGRKKLVFNKDYDTYEDLVSAYRKRRNLLAGKEHNESLRVFLDSLPRLDP